MLQMRWAGFCSGFLVVFALQVPGGSDPLDIWTLRSPVPTGGDLYGITYANGKFVAVGGRVIAVSADGVTWTGKEWDETNSSNSGYYFNAAAYGNGEFVVVGKQSHLLAGSSIEDWSSMVLTSPDGTTWTPADAGITNFLNGVAWGGGVFVAVGDDGVALNSPDGITWSAVGSASADSLRSIAWGNGNFAAVGDDGIIVVSSDGTTWSQASSGITNWHGGGFKTVTYGNGLFVAGGVASGTNPVPVTAVCTSPDGMNWTPRKVDNYWTMRGIAYGTNRFIGVGDSGMILTSTNGVNWSSQVTAACNGFQGVVWGKDQFVTVGTNGRILTSPDGVSWTQRNSGGPWYLQGAAYGNGGFVAVGQSGAILTRDENNVWISRICTGGDGLDSIAYGAGRFVAVGPWLNTSVSPDAVNWQSELGAGGNSISWGNGLFVAVGPGPVILTSPDGIKWTSRRSETAYDLNAIAYGNGQFMAVGNTGTILNSYDGINWIAMSTLVTKPLFGVAYGNGRFVAVGYSLSGGVAVTILDGGFGWGQVPLGLHPNSIAFGGGQFVAVGSGPILTSPDGASWTERPRQESYGLRAVAYGAGRFIAVGYNGTIFESGVVLVAPRLWPIALLSNGTAQVGVIGTEGETYTIQASANLLNWVDFTSITITNGAGQFSDPAVTTNWANRLYRALAP